MSVPERKYGLYSQGSSGWTSFKKEELQEEDVWGVFNETDKFSTMYGVANRGEEASATSVRRITTAAKMIPRSNCYTEPKMSQQQHSSSAPVNIPDWSKIYGKSSNLQASNGDGFVRSSWESDEDEEDENGGMVMPPHEWLAKKHARSEISSFSVCEGVGRTLKGRDISRVRNAVLTKTGFLE